jgi:hypothetical protein
MLLSLLFSPLFACTAVQDDEDSASDELPPTDSDDDSGTEDCPPSFEIVGEYGHFTLDGWPIYMGLELLEEDTALGCSVFHHLGGDLATIRSALTSTRIDRLHQVNVWIELDEPAFPGAVYHPSESWLETNGYPVEWAGGIQIGNAQNYLDWTEVQPAIVLHELSHAWHHQVVGYDDSTVLEAYNAAMSSGLYDAVEYADGTIQEAYATTNVQEYFAELSEAWFWSNDFQPFDHAELLSFDPAGASAVEQAWATIPD